MFASNFFAHSQHYFQMVSNIMVTYVESRRLHVLGQASTLFDMHITCTSSFIREELLVSNSEYKQVLPICLMIAERVVLLQPNGNPGVHVFPYFGIL